MMLLINTFVSVFTKTLKKSRISIACAVTLTLITASCSKVPSGPNIILVTIDTLRADHLSCYGYEKETSPYIDSIARRGILFESAYATSPWTAPSMASIFTSLYPRHHGVLHGFFSSNSKIVDQEVLSSRLPNMVRTLRKAGYTTFGVSSNGHMSRETGFDQGFDHFETIWFGRAPDVNRIAMKWKPVMDTSPKYFLWVHYFDPHDPYRANNPWLKAYGGNTKYHMRLSRMTMKTLREFLDKGKITARVQKALLDLYDSEIHFTDHHLKKLLESLGLEKNNLIIITSDHGEEFLDHGHLGHARTLYEESTRVPLIVRLPSDAHAGRTVREPVSNKNIFPTLLDTLGIKTPETVTGDSLLKGPDSDLRKMPEAVHMELDRGRYWEAIRRDRWKLIFSGRKNRRYSLFDLNTDPFEKVNIKSKHPDLAQNMKAELEQWLSKNPQFKAPKTAVVLDKSKKQKLRSLGYIK